MILQRTVTARQSDSHVDHGARRLDTRHARELWVQVLVKARAWALHGEVCQAEQRARRALHFVRGDTIDQVHREPERDAERNREHGEEGAPGRMT